MHFMIVSVGLYCRRYSKAGSK